MAIREGSPGPVRMCVACRARLPKGELARHVASGPELVHDPEQTMPGRGYYLCGDEKCLKRFRTFKVRPKK